VEQWLIRSRAQFAFATVDTRNVRRKSIDGAKAKVARLERVLGIAQWIALDKYSEGGQIRLDVVRHGNIFRRREGTGG
jgi:hypothetical protein